MQGKKPLQRIIRRQDMLIAVKSDLKAGGDGFLKEGEVSLQPGGQNEKRPLDAKFPAEGEEPLFPVDRRGNRLFLGIGFEAKGVGKLFDIETEKRDLCHNEAIFQGMASKGKPVFFYFGRKERIPFMDG